MTGDMRDIPAQSIDSQIEVAKKKIDAISAHANVTEVVNSDNQQCPWTPENAMVMSATVIGFSLIVFSMATYLIKHGKPSESVLKIFGTLFIITAATLLILLGFGEKQISPVIGLLGTLAGYLLGRETKDN